MTRQITLRKAIEGLIAWKDEHHPDDSIGELGVWDREPWDEAEAALAGPDPVDELVELLRYATKEITRLSRGVDGSEYHLQMDEKMEQAIEKYGNKEEIE